MRRHAPPKAAPPRAEKRDHQSCSFVTRCSFLGGVGEERRGCERGVAGKLAVRGAFPVLRTSRKTGRFVGDSRGRGARARFAVNRRSEAKQDA